MTSANPDVKTIFGNALALTAPDARDEYLKEACGENIVLRAEVDELLVAIDQAGSFMNRPVDLEQTVEGPHICEGPGTLVGRYKLLEPIGEGGFGVVFMAEQQEPIVRKVALKIIKPGMDSKEVIARFEAERQALALMDHPNIAKVLDAGTTETGRPYFVMELVRGVPITDYCRVNEIATDERLRLFVSVCQAVHHAHQKGILHRDIKPTNILITMHDGVPVVKVIDFGLAKALNQRLTEKTLFTRFSAMIGTPLYMSPEQAEMSGLDVDTRTDIYSLGVLVYELLTGTTPFDRERLKKAAFDELRRIIQEEEPPKPSTRISTVQKRATANAATPNPTTAVSVQQDLDWIVMKALEKNRNRRYETAKDFADDVQRHLKKRPVEARPPSTAYRFQRFAARNRVALTTAGTLAAVILSCATLLIWQNLSTGNAKKESAIALTAQMVRQLADEKKFSEALTLLKEIDESGFGDHWAVIEAKLHLAHRCFGNERFADAVALLEAVLSYQLRTQGAAEAPTLATKERLGTAYPKLLNHYALTDSDEELERAYVASKRLTTLVEDANSQTWLAWYAARLGEAEEAWRIYGQLQPREQGPSNWIMRCLLHQKKGENREAKDWLLACCEDAYNTNPGLYFKPEHRWRIDTHHFLADLVGVSPEWPPPKWSPEATRDLYTRLIASEPQDSFLYSRRGLSYSRENLWEEAYADFERAVDVSPNLNNRTSLAASCLILGKNQEYSELCLESVKTIAPSYWSQWRDLLVLCCIAPQTRFNLNEIEYSSEDVWASPNFGVRSSLRTAELMLAYRREEYAKAIGVLGPFGPFRREIGECYDAMNLLFDAMANQKVGNSSEARELLRQADEYLEAVVPTPDGQPHVWGDRSITWAIAKVVREEASKLIEEAQPQTAE